MNLGDFLYAPRKFDINERNALYEWSYEKVKEDKTHWLEIIIPVIPLGAGIIIYIFSFAYSKFKGFDVCNGNYSAIENHFRAATKFLNNLP